MLILIKLSVFYFVFYWSMTIVNVFLPLLFGYKGLTPAEIGVVIASAPIIAIFSQPLWGIISDKYQTVKKIILLLLVASLLLGMSVFFSSTMILLIVSMLLFQFFMAPIQPLMDSLATNISRENGGNYGS